MTGWRLAVVVRLGSWLVRLLATTWRVRMVGRERFLALKREGGVLLVLWHGELLPTMVLHGPDPAHAVISQSKDGELIARVSAAFGARAIRGSSSRGGAEALAGMVQAARDGQVVAVTPDGPRGPRHSVAPGVVITAKRAGVPVIGVRVVADRAWRFASWDRFMIPKPFARVTYAYTERLAFDEIDVRTGCAQIAEAQRSAAAAVGGED